MTTLVDAFLADILSRPNDDVTRMICADWLDEAGPTPVKLHHLPNWLRLAWVRTRLPTDIPTYGSPAAWAIAQEIAHWLSRTDCPNLDHWGSTVIDGKTCFVNEPYADLEPALRHLLPLSERLGCPVAYARQTQWGSSKKVSGLVRVLVFPPLDGLPPKQKRRRLWAYDLVDEP